MCACGPLATGGVQAPTTPTAPPAPSVQTEVPRTTAPAPVATEVFIGAIDDLPVRATLSLSKSGIAGHWVYERGGDPWGLAIETVRAEGSEHHGIYFAHERTRAGEVVGEMSLHLHRDAIEGTWKKPGDTRERRVLLTREQRARQGENVIRARRIMAKPSSVLPQGGPLFLPVIEGPAATLINPSLTLRNLLNEDEFKVAGAESLTTGLDFEIDFFDERVLALYAYENTMGAYPSGDSHTLVVDLQTGRPLGVETFEHSKRKALIHRIDASIHAAWKAHKDELMKGPNSSGSCGPDFVETFMKGNGPTFSERDLEGFHVYRDGLGFVGGINIPHAFLACAPALSVRLPWSEASAYIDAGSPLRGRK